MLFEYEEDDAEVAYEILQELQDEYNANNQAEDSELRGLFMPLERRFRVKEALGVTPDELEEALKTDDMWELSDHMRAAVYCHLEEKAKRKILAEVVKYNRDYQTAAREFKIANMEKDAHIVGNAKLVGMTTTGLSKYRSLVASTQPKVVLIEEAAEVLEGPVAVGCMPTVQHLILVGDHKQLQGKTSVHLLASEPYYLNVSMFERLVMNNMPFVVLKTQRRMRPEIREILTPIYQDQLEDHVSVLGRDPVPGMGNVNLYFFCHNSPEENPDDSPSKCNKFEAQMIVKFLEYFMYNQVQPADITILTFYTGQRGLLAKLISQNAETRNKPFKLATVDSYQGEENDIIILSLVRSNFDNQVGFLDVSNRVCVALSRAQRGLYIFGDGQMITNASELWWDVGMILNRPPARIGTELPLKCHRHKATTKIEGVNDWEDINGGCKRPCREVLPCKHICPLKCHPFEHDIYRCLEQCKKAPMACGHLCEQRCYVECRCEPCDRTRAEMEADPLLALATEDSDTSAPLAEQKSSGTTRNGGITLGPRPENLPISSRRPKPKKSTAANDPSWPKLGSQQTSDEATKIVTNQSRKQAWGSGSTRN